MQDIIGAQHYQSAKYSRKDPLAAFHAYDIRGLYPDELDVEVAYKITKAFLKISPGKRYVIGHDMRSSSKALADAIIQAIVEEDLIIDSIGEVTSDALYFSVGKYNYDGGVMITASHNSAQFNGIKFVKSQVSPVIMDDLKEAFQAIENTLHYLPLASVEPTTRFDPTAEFVQHIVSFSAGTKFKSIKIVVDAGNGMAGKIVTAVCKAHPEIVLIPMYFEPHPDFPHHEANPAISTNLLALQSRVKLEQADLGVAFDGDADRVFFIDNTGEMIEGYHLQTLLTEYFLNLNRGATVIYDLRNTRAIESVIRVTGGRGVVSKAGHTFIKQKMRQEDAVFGGESTSSHFYYRDNYYADSGVITFEIIMKILCETGANMYQLVKTYRDRFFSSQEKNFYVKSNNKFAELIQRLKNEFPTGSFSDFDGFVIDFPTWRFSLRESNTEPFWRLNVEGETKSLLAEKEAALFNVLEEFGQYTGNVSNLYGLQTLNLSKKEKLEFLFDNLYYTWNRYKGNYLDDLYGTEWSRNQTPLSLLREIDLSVLDSFYEKNLFNIEETIRVKQTYLNNDTWFDKLAANDKLLSRLLINPVLYFSLEFGLVDWLEIYAGGLGILAGDTLKEASDSGLPLIGIGLFYAQGYFDQRFTEDGWQIEDYLTQDTDDYPMETVKDQNNLTLVVDVKLGAKVIKVRAWRIRVGRRSLLLLDTNFTANEDIKDRMITYHLYGGDQDTRIQQEIILAMGGYKIIQALGIKPSILHLNEGHSAFAVLAQAQDIMRSQGISFNEAIVKSRKNILFTNHTLKQAGNDVFPYSLVEKYLGIYAQDMMVDFRNIFSLGVDSIYAEGRFGMTILGLNNAAKINAVSQIHAEAAKKVWPDHLMEPVTNGIHLPTWVSAELHDLFDEYVGERWSEQLNIMDWDKIDNIPPARLWEAHLVSKRALIKELETNVHVNIPETALVLGWFRRFTAYKQHEVLTLDLERL